MFAKLAMIHSIAGLVPMFDGLCAELMPGVERIHIADEAVLRMVLAAGQLTPAACRRVCDDAAAAEMAGADVILVTCSSISPCVDAARQLVSVPVLKIDEPMADRAVSLGTRIGVAATAPTTLGPTRDLVQARARAAGKEVQVEALLCEGAYEALFAGRQAEHDRIVRECLQRLMARNDVVVLAQASMARVADQAPEAERATPILSSPRLGMERTRDVIRGLGKE